MNRFTLFFLYTLLVDGVITVIGAVGGLSAGVWAAVGGFVSLGVLALALALFTGMVFTPRLPKRILLPPILFVAFCMVWGLLFGRAGQLPLAVSETFLALGLLIGYQGPTGEFQHFAEKRPSFSFRHFAVTAPVFLAIALVTAAMLTVSAAQRIRCKVEDSLDHYLTVDRAGLSLEERRFKKGDQEIRLIGMMHVARSGFYDQIAKALPAHQDAVVLVEGVTDHDRLLSGKLDYSRVANLVGISSQAESSFNRDAMEGLKKTASGDGGEAREAVVEYRSGDIDASEFSPATIRCIRSAQSLLHSGNWREFVENYSVTEKIFEMNGDAAFKDILEHRNEHLLGEIRNSLREHHTIVVPWGAQHMPGLQREIERWGFTETSRTRHLALHFKNRWLVGLVGLMDWLPSDRNP